MDSIVTPPTSRTCPSLESPRAPACIVQSARLDQPKPEVAFQKAEVGFDRASGWISRSLRLDFAAFASATLRNEVPLPYGTSCRTYGTRCRTLRNDGKVEHLLVRDGPSKPSRPYNPNLDAVKQALFSLRAARNKINERWPVTKECIDILDQLASEASQLAAEYDTEDDTEDDDFEE